MPRSTISQITSALYFGAILFVLAISASSPAQVMAQIGGPQVPGFSNYYPWFNEVPPIRQMKAFGIFWRIIRTSLEHSRGNTRDL